MTSLKSLAKWLLIIMLIGAPIVFVLTGGQDWLSLETFKAYRQELQVYTEQHYSLALLIAGLVYITAVALSFPGATVLSLAVGFLFGRWVGTAVIVIAATTGGLLVFLAARYLLGVPLQQRFRHHPGFLRITRGFQRNGFYYLLFLRLVPAFPFWLVNLAPAFTPMQPHVYVIATAIGILPGSFVFANLGQSMGRIDSLAGLLSWQTLVALGLLGGLAMLPVVLRPKEAADGRERMCLGCNK